MAARNRLAEAFEEERKKGRGIQNQPRTETGKAIPQAGQRPFPSEPKNLAPIQEEIKRVQEINKGARIMTGMDAARRRREGQLRNPRGR